MFHCHIFWLINLFFFFLGKIKSRCIKTTKLINYFDKLNTHTKNMPQIVKPQLTLFILFLMCKYAQNKKKNE